MTDNSKHANLGDPDLKIAGFQLWVLGRQYPDSEAFHDGNWLMVTAHCGAGGASVWTDGPIVLVQDLAKFIAECEAMRQAKAYSATLEPCEPELNLTLEGTDGLGHVRLQVEITPDHLSQAHRFEFEIDLSTLQGIIEQCSKILQRYAIRGTPG